MFSPFTGPPHQRHLTPRNTCITIDAAWSDEKDPAATPPLRRFHRRYVHCDSVSGSIIASEDELYRWFRPDLFSVKAQSTTLPAAALGEIALKAFPGERMMVYVVPPTADRSAVIALRGLQVFMDPYTGAILGTRSGPTFLQKNHQFHIRLLAGRTGETIVRIAAIVLLFLVLSGVVLWWPLKRLTIKWSASWRRINFDLHQAAGIYSSLFLLLLTCTGLMIGFDGMLMPLVFKATNSQPPVYEAQSTPQAGVKPLTAEQALTIAASALPGTKPIFVTVPGGPKAAIRVSLRFPEDLTPAGRSWVLLDQFSGEVLVTQNSRTTGAGTRLVIMNRAIHTGDIFGTPSKVVAALSSLVVVIQMVTGLFMWWKKDSVAKRQKEASLATTGVEL